MANERQAAPATPTLLGLIGQYGWSTVFAVLFVSLYFGWLPDSRREALDTVAAGMRGELAGMRTEIRRLNERQIKIFSMLTEICLAAHRHDPKSIDTCSYVYSNHAGDAPPAWYYGPP